jgi:hypothetical protein
VATLELFFGSKSAGPRKKKYFFDIFEILVKGSLWGMNFETER